MSHRFSFAAIVATGLTLATQFATPAFAADTPLKPNIVYILCDDLGIGDIHAFNLTRGKIATPNVDKLAAEGMSFTDAHSSDSVCSPSRYGILTGRYAWRTQLQKGVLLGTDLPLIEKDQLTMPTFLKNHGYATAAIGKWHLGLQLGNQVPNSGGIGEKPKDYKMNWADPITDGPLQHGFDYYFGIAASLDMPPFVYIENNMFTEIPSATKKWGREGPAAPDFEAVNVLPDLTHKAVDYITTHAADAKKTGPDAKPFFLYLAFSAPHTPIVPTPEWKGKSGLSDYGDFVMEVDDCAGQVIKAVDAAGLADNTIVVFTSDNGCSPAAKTDQLEKEGHFASAQFRGYKADIWDGGHRIPFIVRWPSQVKPGAKTNSLICLTDMFATCVDIAGEKLPANAGEDSVSMLPVLQAKAPESARDNVVHHSINGFFAIRKGKWKLELCYGSGGWAAPREPAAMKAGLPSEQLYDMSGDEGETKNVASANPEIVKELTAELDKYIKSGRTTPGPNEPNDAGVKIVMLKNAAEGSPAAKAAQESKGD